MVAIRKMNSSPHLFILSYWTYNDPKTFVGALRPFRMHAFFKGKGWDVTLITPGDATAENSHGVHCIPESRWMRSILFRALSPDSTLLWALKVLWKLRTKIRQNGPIYFLTTCPPNGLVVAGLLGKWIFAKSFRWILDFRDLWTHHPLYAPPITKKYFDPWLEKLALRRADLVLCNTAWDEAHWSARFPGQQSKFLTVTNGFDQILPNHTLDGDDKLRFVYTGGTTAGQASRWVRDLLGEWQKQGVVATCDFYGEYDALMDTTPWIEYYGTVSHDAVPDLLTGYRYGFIYLPKGSEKGGRVAQKFYDYLGSGVIPICYRPSQEMRRWMHELDTGVGIDEGESAAEVLNKIRSAKFRVIPGRLTMLQRSTQFEKLYNSLPSLL